MFSVYLVDDDLLAVEHLKNSVQWQEHYLYTVGSSTNPLEAIEEILNLKPDVVLTDIVMPQIDGIEMIRRLKLQGSNAQFAVLSAYESFEYAHEVIILDGIDYLTKPIDTEQFEDFLYRLHSKLGKSKILEAGSPITFSSELNHIVGYLHKNFSNQVTLQQLSVMFSISLHHICRLFSKHLGMSFSMYLTQLRMKHAQELLQTTTLSIKEIASQCGYENYFYFSRVFTKRIGIPPTLFRRTK